MLSLLEWECICHLFLFWFLFSVELFPLFCPLIFCQVALFFIFNRFLVVLGICVLLFSFRSRESSMNLLYELSDRFNFFCFLGWISFFHSCADKTFFLRLKSRVRFFLIHNQIRKSFVFMSGFLFRTFALAFDMTNFNTRIVAFVFDVLFFKIYPCKRKFFRYWFSLLLMTQNTSPQLR